MARTPAGIIRLQPSETTTKRPEREPPKGSPEVPIFGGDLGAIQAIQIDDDSVMLFPNTYCCDPDDSPDAEWRNDYAAKQCWKAVVAYEQIGESHPHIVPFKHRDPWTALPVLAKPSGPPLTDFLDQHRETMYSTPLDEPSSRILKSHQPLAYQWTLHIISALAFVHSHDIIFGELELRQCWLSSSLDLSLLSFTNAGFRNRSQDYRLVDGDHGAGNGFAPPENIVKPTKKTDLFWFANTVFALMTGHWPGHHLGDDYEKKAADMVERREWLPLEDQYMGKIVHKCWGGEFNSAEEVQAAVIAFLREQGWEVEGDDHLKGFVATDLFSQRG